MQEKREKNKVLSTVKTIVYFVVIGFLLLYSLIEIFMPDQTARVMQIKASYVETTSMEPKFGPYDMIFMTAPRHLEKGDIITYKGTLRVLEQGSDGVYRYIDYKDQIITHRIVRYDEARGGYITKGDKEGALEDPYVVKEEQMIGKYMFSIPKIGYVYAFITSWLGLVVIIVNLTVIIVIVQIVKKDRKKNHEAL